MANKSYPVTPDGRYFLVKERLWRCTNPSLPEPERQRLVQELMAARRLVRTHKHQPEQLALSRRRVQAAKVGLGERGPVWWNDGAPDYNRRAPKNTPYEAWFKALPKGD